MADRPHILVVDDEPQITRVLRTSLSAQGYDIRIANSGEMALEIMKDWSPSLIITDLSMPSIDGVQLCRTVRAVSQVPIVVLSVRDKEQQKVEALDAGADDYVTKPFGMNELLARVRANLRRVPAESEPEDPVIEIGDFRIDTARAQSYGPAQRSAAYSEGIRSAGVSGAASRQSREPPHSAGRYLGRAEHRAGGISPRVRRPVAQETGTRRLFAALHRHRALGWISVRTGGVSQPTVAPAPYRLSREPALSLPKGRPSHLQRDTAVTFLARSSYEYSTNLLFNLLRLSSSNRSKADDPHD